MASSIEDILYAKALADAEGNGELAGTLGAVGGSVLGVGLGTPGHYIGQGKLAIQDKFQPHYTVTKRNNVGDPIAMDIRGATPRHQLLQQRIRPGSRMAGGLIGAILGGGLGLGAEKALTSSSRAGEMLGKIQATGGNLTGSERTELEDLLGSIYSDLGVL